MKIKIIGGEVCLRRKGKTLLGIVNHFFHLKVCWQMFCLYTFPAHNLNVHWRWGWWDRIQAIFLLYWVKFQCSAALKVIGSLPHGNCIDKSINSAQLICPIFILSKSKVKQYCSTNFGVTFPDQISGAYTHEKAYNFLPEMENLIRLVFCGHVLVWYFVG